eukprot:g38230.t1
MKRSQRQSIARMQKRILALSSPPLVAFSPPTAVDLPANKRSRTEGKERHNLSASRRMLTSSSPSSNLTITGSMVGSLACSIATATGLPEPIALLVAQHVDLQDLLFLGHLRRGAHLKRQDQLSGPPNPPAGPLPGKVAIARVPAVSLTLLAPASPSPWR